MLASAIRNAGPGYKNLVYIVLPLSDTTSEECKNGMGSTSPGSPSSFGGQGEGKQAASSVPEPTSIVRLRTLYPCRTCADLPSLRQPKDASTSPDTANGDATNGEATDGDFTNGDAGNKSNQDESMVSSYVCVGCALTM